ncbi:MAG TPA: glycoside hydrolase family 3 N-terminal domain-containing protein [Planctomycetota bacterium]|nr:glycoside hydrolase family 3 N-terminal domain-containing protein [Planctomycetota bacterium]
MGDDRWSRGTLETLDVETLVGQMLWTYTQWDADTVSMVDRGWMGGIISRGTRKEPPNLHDVPLFVNELQQRSPLPMLFLEDFEFGVGYLIRGATEFTSAMGLAATNDVKCAYEVGRITALESRALGYHVPIVPVLDVNVNPANPIINVRSFGEDPERVAAFGVAFARGIRDAGCLACGKHFPGHGDTDTDSHRFLPSIPHDRARMDAVELVPFKRCIDAGIEMIMSAHILFPAVDDSGLPATLSRRILTGLLRDELGFDGIITTDAMSMKAIADNYPAGEAEVKAVEAGADFILCIQSKPAHEAIVQAVKSGRIPLEQVRASAARILRAKERLKLHEKRTVDPGVAWSVVGTDEHRQKALEIARRSMTLLRGTSSRLDARKRLLAVIVRAERPTKVASHEVLAAELKRHVGDVRCVFIDETPDAAAVAEVTQAIAASDQALFATFARVECYKETSGGHAPVQEAVTRVLARSGKPFAAASFGSPYVLGRLADAQTLLAAWYDSDVCIEAACEVLSGKRTATGTSPVTIPGVQKDKV